MAFKYNPITGNLDLVGSSSSGSGVQSIVAGTNITVDNTDPANPIVNATGGSLTLTEVEVNLGSAPRDRGKFNITSSGLTVGKAVIVSQANGPYTGKGTLSDEAEMDGLVVSGKVTSTTNIECFYKSDGMVRSNFKFNYQVSS